MKINECDAFPAATAENKNINDNNGEYLNSIRIIFLIKDNRGHSFYFQLSSQSLIMLFWV